MTEFITKSGILFVLVSLTMLPYTKGIGTTVFLVMFCVGVLMFLFPPKEDGDD